MKPQGLTIGERQRRLWEILKHARDRDDNEKSGSLNNFVEVNELIDHNPSMIFDDTGRLVRWIRQRDEP